jgi:hypothetical protein
LHLARRRHRCHSQRARRSRPVQRPSRRWRAGRDQSGRGSSCRPAEVLRRRAVPRRTHAAEAAPARCEMWTRRRTVQAQLAHPTICARARRSRQRLSASLPKKTIEIIQRRTRWEPGLATITDAFWPLDWLVAIGGKIQLPVRRPILGRRRRRWLATLATERGRSLSARDEQDHEEDLSAKEAQACPCPRVPQPHGFTCGAADAEAPSRQGTQAPLDLMVVVA